MNKLDELSVESPSSCKGSSFWFLKCFISEIKNIRMELNPASAPHQLLYARVSIEWKDHQWFDGTIDNFNPQRGMHHILYDDGQKRWYAIDENLIGHNEKGTHAFRILQLDDSVLNDPEITSMRHLAQNIINSNKKYFELLFRLLRIPDVEGDVWLL